MFRAASFALALVLIIAGIVGSRVTWTSVVGMTHKEDSHSSATSPIASTPTFVPGKVKIARLTPIAEPAPRAPGRQHSASNTKQQAGVSIPPVAPAGFLAPQSPPRPDSVVPARYSYRILPTGTTGVVTLINYWMGRSRAMPGQTVPVQYVISNGTGVTRHLLLGASIRWDGMLGWRAHVISDLPHDVVAIVPPGVTTHLRYFTVPADIPRGSYDVAWGLRDVDTGRRVALTSALGALRVSR